ncbi:MAG: hypothetical protein H6975_01230 [Gammaproteobacteria bacterium]|nr:hypothetical protein [Gammaproteobacteria bacterium]
MDTKFRSDRVRCIWPIMLAILIWIANLWIDAFDLSLPTQSDILFLLLSTGTTDNAARVMAALFSFFVLFWVLIKFDREEDILDKFLNRNLPALILGFGLGCFLVGSAPIMGILYGLSGFLLLNDEFSI